MTAPPEEPHSKKKKKNREKRKRESSLSSSSSRLFSLFGLLFFEITNTPVSGFIQGGAFPGTVTGWGVWLGRYAR